MIQFMQETVKKQIEDIEKIKESNIAENMKKLRTCLAKATKKDVSDLTYSTSLIVFVAHMNKSESSTGNTKESVAKKSSKS